MMFVSSRDDLCQFRDLVRLQDKRLRRTHDAYLWKGEIVMGNEYHSTASRVSCDTRGGLAGVPRCGRHGEMAATEWIYREGHIICDALF